MKRVPINRQTKKDQGGTPSPNDDLVFSGDMEFFTRAVTRMPPQFVGVLSGKPGSCKSTLLTQCAIAAAIDQNRSTLILLSEEAVQRAEERLNRLIGKLSATKQ